MRPTTDFHDISPIYSEDDSLGLSAECRIAIAIGAMNALVKYVTVEARPYFMEEIARLENIIHLARGYRNQAAMAPLNREQVNEETLAETTEEETDADDFSLTGGVHRGPGRPRLRDEETAVHTIRVTVTMLAYLREYESPGILIEEALKRTKEFREWAKGRKGKR